MEKSVEVTIVYEKQEEGNYSCFVEEKFDKFGLAGYGSTAREAEEDLYVSERETKEILEEKGVKMPKLVYKKRKFDVGSFFSYYPYFNITQFAKYSGLNPSQMRQYASGNRKPTKEKKEQINAAIRNLAETLLSNSRAFCIDWLTS